MSTALPSSANTHSRPSVSAVIPAYNAAKTIERALNSVYAQTYDNIIEVIVVDDGSTDDTAAVVRAKFPDAILVRQVNRGVSGARNAGAGVASGEYIAFLDADDEWFSDKLTLHMAAIARSPQTVLLTSALSLCPLPRPSSCETRPTSANEVVQPLAFDDVIRRRMPNSVAFCCSGWVVRREAFIAEGGLDASLSAGEDWEFLLRLTGQGHQVAALLAPLYRYHVLSSSVSNSTKGRLELCRLDLEIIRRYDPAVSGWQSELLSPQEFREVLHANYYSLAWWALDLDDRDLAREYLREAAELAPGSALSKLRHRFAAWQPGWYRALSRMSRGSAGSSR